MLYIRAPYTLFYQVSGSDKETTPCKIEEKRGTDRKSESVRNHFGMFFPIVIHIFSVFTHSCRHQEPKAGRDLSQSHFLAQEIAS